MKVRWFPGWLYLSIYLPIYYLSIYLFASCCEREEKLAELIIKVADRWTKLHSPPLPGNSTY